jgi:hypothetical protein
VAQGAGGGGRYHQRGTMDVAWGGPRLLNPAWLGWPGSLIERCMKLAAYGRSGHRAVADALGLVSRARAGRQVEPAAIRCSCGRPRGVGAASKASATGRRREGLRSDRSLLG